MNEEKMEDNLNKLHVERSFGKQIVKMHNEWYSYIEETCQFKSFFFI